jgi:hypothetical protein
MSITDLLDAHRATLQRMILERLTVERLGNIADSIVAKAERGDLAALRTALGDRLNLPAPRAVEKKEPAPAASPKPPAPARPKPINPKELTPEQAELLADIFVRPRKYQDVITNMQAAAAPDPAVSDPSTIAVVNASVPPAEGKSPPPTEKPNGKAIKSG